MEFVKSLSTIRLVGQIDSQLNYSPEKSEYSLILRVHSPDEPRLQGHFAVLRDKQKIVDWINFLLNTGKNASSLEASTAPTGFSIKHDLERFDAFEFSTRSFWDGERKFIVLGVNNPANLRRSHIILLGTLSEYRESIAEFIDDLVFSLQSIKLFNDNDTQSMKFQTALLRLPPES